MADDDLFLPEHKGLDGRRYCHDCDRVVPPDAGPALWCALIEATVRETRYWLLCPECDRLRSLVEAVDEVGEEMEL
jgi:hypothetical protein